MTHTEDISGMRIKMKATKKSSMILQHIIMFAATFFFILVSSTTTVSVSGQTTVHGQLMSEASIEEQLMNALIETSGNTTQTQTVNVTKSELAQTIDRIVDADPSCNVLFNTCASIIYESDSRIVFVGDLIKSLSYNVAIWLVVDMLETEGFGIDSIELTGQGSKGNPHSYLIVMSRSG
ncbi:MAG: hypothetical protein ACRD5J_10720 [Nitrososphaeraceae archaeon]